MADARVDILLSLRSRITGVDSIISSLGRVAKAGALAGAALAVFAAKQSIDTAGAFVDMANRAQTSIEAVQVLGRAAEDAGASLGDMEKSLILVARNSEEAANGNTKLNDALGNLGLSARALRGMAPERQFEEIARAVETAENRQAALNDASEILGTKQMPKLLEVMQRLGKQGYAGLRDEISRTHGIMSDATATQLETAGDRLAQLQNRMTTFAGETVVKLMPLIEALERVAGWAVNALQTIQELTEYAAGSAANVVNFFTGTPVVDLTGNSTAAPSSAPTTPPRDPAAEAAIAEKTQRARDLRALEFELANRRAELAKLDGDVQRTAASKMGERITLLKEERRILEDIDAKKRAEEGVIGLKATGGRTINQLRSSGAEGFTGDAGADISPQDLKTLNEQNKRVQEIDEVRAKITELRFEFLRIGESLQQGIGSSLRGLIDQTMTWSDALMNVGQTLTQGVMNAFIDEAAQSIALETKKFIIYDLFQKKKVASTAAATAANTATTVAGATAEGSGVVAASAPGGIMHSIMQLGPIAGPLAFAGAIAAMLALVGSLAGGRAYGGAVQSGRPYLIGEKGVPEVFQSDVSGTIFPSVSAYNTHLAGIAAANAPGSGTMGGSAARSGSRGTRILMVDDARQIKANIMADPDYEDHIVRVIGRRRFDIPGLGA